MSAFGTYKALFPHPDVYCMHMRNAEPTYESIEAAEVQINANSAAIHLNSRDGDMGHLILTIIDT